MIGRLHHVVLDCPEPATLATFYARVLGQPVTYRSDDFWVVAQDHTTSGLAFQRAAAHRRPTWPQPDVPQQLHLDVMVDDVEVAGAAVVELGAQRLAGGDGVYADPAGHPFCLVARPAWAAPVRPG